MSICHAAPLDDRGYDVPCGANISPFRPNAEAEGGSCWSGDPDLIECKACLAWMREHGAAFHDSNGQEAWAW